MTGKAAASPAHWRYATENAARSQRDRANAKRLWTRDPSSIRCPKRTLPLPYMMRN
jgi:hypothetical protein